jgi:hypothetical protein
VTGLSAAFRGKEFGVRKALLGLLQSGFTSQPIAPPSDLTSLRHLSTLRILFPEPLAFAFGCEIITNDASGGRGTERRTSTEGVVESDLKTGRTVASLQNTRDGRAGFSWVSVDFSRRGGNSGFQACWVL